jgi:hypothetical protein
MQILYLQTTEGDFKKVDFPHVHAMRAYGEIQLHPFLTSAVLEGSE